MLKTKLAKHPFFLTLYACFVSFGLYLCFYPFRRAYTAALFENLSYFGISYKVLLIMAQLLGFALSKGIGIRVVSEMLPMNRAKNLLFFVALSWLLMGLFAITPSPYNLFFMFLANLPLGMVYGMVLGFLEGRKNTDLMVAALTASFILGSGFAKGLGKWLIDTLHVSETAMPFWAGACMFPFLSLFVWAIHQIPPPNEEDIALRSNRQAMNKEQRRHFIKEFGLGIVLLVLSYVLLTTYRELRDNFTPEIWKELGYEKQPTIFIKTEIPIAIFILVLMASMRWIKNNPKAFRLLEILLIVGGMLIGFATFLFQQKIISPENWIILSGLGAYLAYSLCNSLYFERMLATFKVVGTVGFIITFADYYAYFGSILVFLYKNFFQAKVNYVDFFIKASYFTSLLYALCTIGAFLYYQKKMK